MFTNLIKIQKLRNWVWTTRREPEGLFTDAIGWNYSTGAAGLSLALLLGAKTINLLGFDMHLTDGRINWHDNLLDKPDIEVYQNFLRGFDIVKRDLKKFPDVKVFNITDCSSLEVFPKIGVEEFWENRK